MSRHYQAGPITVQNGNKVSLHIQGFISRELPRVITMLLVKKLPQATTFGNHILNRDVSLITFELENVSTSLEAIDQTREALGRISDKEIRNQLDPPMFKHFEKEP